MKIGRNKPIPHIFLVGYVLISFEQNLGYSFNVGNGYNAIIFKAIIFLRFAVAVTNSLIGFLKIWNKPSFN